MVFKKIAENIKTQISSLKLGSLILWFACKNSKTPIVAKVICFVIVAYALSPIDLIPDFIPILGYLDDLILLPLLISFALKFLPDHVYLESKALAEDWLRNLKRAPKSKLGLVIVLSIWLGIGCSLYFAANYLIGYLP